MVKDEVVARMTVKKISTEKTADDLYPEMTGC